VCVLYDNILINTDNINEIKQIFTERNNFTEYYINNIFMIIKKIIEMDFSIKYNINDIPLPYLNVYKIICDKYNQEQIMYQYIKQIINGNIYKVKTENIEENIVNNIIDNSIYLKDNEWLNNNQIYQLEVINWISDEETNEFLNLIEKLNENELKLLNDTKQNIIKYVSEYYNKNYSNMIIKYYIYYRLINFILNIDKNVFFDIVNSNIILNLIKLLNDNNNEELFIIKTAGLQLSNNINQIINKFNNLVESNNKKKYILPDDESDDDTEEYDTDEEYI
jgi:hypothetical protein